MTIASGMSQDVYTHCSESTLVFATKSPQRKFIVKTVFKSIKLILVIKELPQFCIYKIKL